MESVFLLLLASRTVAEAENEPEFDVKIEVGSSPGLELSDLDPVCVGSSVSGMVVSPTTNPLSATEITCPLIVVTEPPAERVEEPNMTAFEEPRSWKMDPEISFGGSKSTTSPFMNNPPGPYDITMPSAIVTGVPLKVRE